jgi:hypothetical protein
LCDVYLSNASLSIESKEGTPRRSCPSQSIARWNGHAWHKEGIPVPFEAFIEDFPCSVELKVES